VVLLEVVERRQSESQLPSKAETDSSTNSAARGVPKPKEGIFHSNKQTQVKILLQKLRGSVRRGNGKPSSGGERKFREKLLGHGHRPNLSPINDFEPLSPPLPQSHSLQSPSSSSKQTATLPLASGSASTKWIWTWDCAVAPHGNTDSHFLTLRRCTVPQIRQVLDTEGTDESHGSFVL